MRQSCVHHGAPATNILETQGTPGRRYRVIVRVFDVDRVASQGGLARRLHNRQGSLRGVPTWRSCIGVDVSDAHRATPEGGLAGGSRTLGPPRRTIGIVSVCPMRFRLGTLKGMASMGSSQTSGLQVPACPLRCRLESLRGESGGGGSRLESRPMGHREVGSCSATPFTALEVCYGKTRDSDGLPVTALF